MSDRIAVIGAGSWGTALAISLASNHQNISLWARRSALAEQMTVSRENAEYLKNAHIPEAIHVTSDLENALEGASMWVFATPSQSIREVGASVSGLVKPDTIVVSVAKGIENNTLMLSSDVLAEVLPVVKWENFGVLYGPSHAEELARGLPTTVVAAATSEDTANIIQQAFNSRRLRVYVNTDIKGVQIAGSVKNVMAIAAGISDGVGFGDNAKAAIVTRGMAEIRRLGLAMGARAETFFGLAGIGDLVVTCMSGLSRNRHLGEQIGKGKRLEEIEAEMNMVAEGVRTTESIIALARRYDIEMPISEAVYAILFEGKKPLDAVSELMNRAAKKEDWLPNIE
ncbi:MAG: NAD(P)H-dependent glycerol-3-phosphate dehydrogenase [Rhodothermales bacterium]